MLNKVEVIKILKTHKLDLENFNVIKIGLFGSFARGEEHSNSDIDILIELKNDEYIYFNYCNVKYFLEDLFDRKVDLLTTNHFNKVNKTDIGKIHQSRVKQNIFKDIIFI